MIGQEIRTKYGKERGLTKRMEIEPNSSWSKVKRQVSSISYPFIHTVLYTSVMTTFVTGKISSLACKVFSLVALTPRIFVVCFKNRLIRKKIVRVLSIKA